MVHVEGSEKVAEAASGYAFIFESKMECLRKCGFRKIFMDTKKYTGALFLSLKERIVEHIGTIIIIVIHKDTSQ